MHRLKPITWRSNSYLLSFFSPSLFVQGLIHPAIEVKMAEFVRAQIFGTTFEITSRWIVPPPMRALDNADVWLDTPTCNLWEWAHSGSSGIFVTPSNICPKTLTVSAQFSQGSADRSGCCSQENHETLQHSCTLETNIQRAEASQAPTSRECKAKTTER